MSGYFVHGGTQFPYGQNPSQQQSSGNQSFYGNTSYPNSQSGGQASQFMSSGSNNFQSSTPNYSQNQFGSNSSGSSNSFGGGNSSTNATSGSGYNSSPFNSSLSSNYPGKSNNNNSASYNFNKGSSGNFGSVQASQSSYEKALFNAANQYYSSRARGGGRGMRGGRGRGGGGGGGRPNFSQNNSGPKPIRAKEIKAFLYAWCGQRKLKPDYEVTTEGEPPRRVLFGCKLQIAGLDHVSQVEATSKKDAQSKAAWDFCQHLVKSGYMKESELPPKPVEPAPKTATGETTRQLGSLPPETQETIDEYGGWTLSNARQRLNQFFQREHTTPEFKHTILGPEHARSFICELKLFVDALKKDFVATETGSNKKQSTAICALSMVRQLFKANLIERQGETIKHVTRGGLLGSKKPSENKDPKPNVEDVTMSANAPVAAPGQKRKADEQPDSDQIDENGNWTVENSRQRLNQFCQVNNLPCDVIYEEEGVPGNRTYTASLNLKVKPSDSDGLKELTASATGQSKKVAAQGCALQLLAQLYKLTLVEANPTAPVPSKKKQQRPRPDQNPFAVPNSSFADYIAYSPAVNRGSVRRTHNLHLNEKHRLIYPSEHELSIVQRSVRMVEQALKEIADQMVDNEADVAGEKKMETDAQNNETKKKSKLQGLLRVGALAKGLLLKGDLKVQLVLLCQEAPTAKLLVKVAQLLPKYMKAAEGDTFSVGTAMPNAAINVTNTVLKTEDSPSLSCSITISLTSALVRTPAQEAVKDAPGSLNKDKCLQALAELRHAKWFQACANGLPSCVVIIRILRHMSRNMKEWKSLSDWALELLVEKALATSPVPLSLGGSFLRVMEVIASGVLLPGGPWLFDPCEREPTDATSNMSNQDREDITRAAQEALRLLVFRQPHKVLGIELIQIPYGRKSHNVPDENSPSEKKNQAAADESIKMES